MKQLISIFLLTVAAWAIDSTELQQFVTGSIVPQNAHYLGFQVTDNIAAITFGTPLMIGDISNDSLENYPESSFSEELSERYVPVILDESIRCFIIIDENDHPVSLGYRKLAEEMTKIAESNTIPVESIALYRSSQINSYLFSVPTRSRGETPNLTILEPNWNRSRSGFTDESTTIAVLRDAMGGQNVQ